jgi:hypothetical protein
MDATDRNRALRHLIAVKLGVVDPGSQELSALRWHLREPIDETDVSNEQRLPDAALALRAHGGRSWGP